MELINVTYKIYCNYAYEYEDINNEDIQELINDFLNTNDLMILDSNYIDNNYIISNDIIVKSNKSFNKVKNIINSFIKKLNINFESFKVSVY